MYKSFPRPLSLLPALGAVCSLVAALGLDKTLVAAMGMGKAPLRYQMEGRLPQETVGVGVVMAWAVRLMGAVEGVCQEVLSLQMPPVVQMVWSACLLAMLQLLLERGSAELVACVAPWVRLPPRLWVLCTA